jgi:two-component system, LytTR family, sensor kinase
MNQFLTAIKRQLSQHWRMMLYHVLAWVFLIAFHIISDHLISPGPRNFSLNFWVSVLVYIPIFYAIYFFALQAYERHKKVWLAIVVILLFFGLYLVWLYYVLKFVYPWVTGIRYKSPDAVMFDQLFVVDSLQLFFLQYFLICLMYWYARRSIRKERELRKSETDRLLLKYAQLKTQINPHFLYNTLNFFYAHTAATHPQVAEGIEKLTDIMRYSLQSGSSVDEKVPLEEELKHVQDVISLHQLRYRNGLCIDFQQNGQAGSLRIIPHVLITLVENALKYGVVTLPETPVVIRLSITGNELVFTTENAIRTSIDRTHTTGLGLENIRQRLQQVYGPHYHFTTHEEGQHFSARLSIRL